MEYLRSQDIPAVMSSWRPKADRISSNDAHQGGDFIASLQNDRIIVSHLTYITASPLPSLSLIIVQNVDPLLTRASFMATERAFHTLTHLLATAREHGAELIIQTSAPDHSLFLQLHAPDSFYREEAVWRKQMHYPPFGRLISVIIPQRALRKPPLTSPPYQGGDGEVSKLKELLKKFNVEVTETVLRHRRKKPVLAFLLKIPHAKVSKDAWSGISGILKERLPGNAIIDVDPDRV